jgi:hypothetical protein
MENGKATVRKKKKKKPETVAWYWREPLTLENTDGLTVPGSLNRCYVFCAEIGWK